MDDINSPTSPETNTPGPKAVPENAGTIKSAPDTSGQVEGLPEPTVVAPAEAEPTANEEVVTATETEASPIEVEPELDNWAKSQGFELTDEQSVKLAKIARDNQSSSRKALEEKSSAEKRLLDALSPTAEPTQAPQEANQTVASSPQPNPVQDTEVARLQKQMDILVFLQKNPEAKKVAERGELDELAVRTNGDLDLAWKAYQFDAQQRGIKKEVKAAKQEERERLSQVTQAASTSASAQGVSTPGASEGSVLDKLAKAVPGSPEYQALSKQYAQTLAR